MTKKFWAASSALVAVVASLLIALPAQADQYPTWQDVQKARSSVTAQKALITKINSAIDQVNDDLAAAQALVKQRGQEAADAQDKADAAALKAQDLQSQADQAEKDAAEAKRQAGVIAAALSRTGGQDLTLTLFASSEDSESLLYKLGTMSKLGELTRQLYNKATTSMNTAQSLTDQANVAKDELTRLSGLAQQALQAAVDAQTAYQKKLEASQETLATLQQQLIVIEQKRDATEADYQAGVAARKAAAEKAAREKAAREKAAREEAAREAAAREEANKNGGGGGTTAPASSGWSNPIQVASQWISSPYGMRADPFGSGRYEFHYGTDIAVACGTIVHAAYGGTVTYAGWYGSTLGYTVILSHGGGVQTWYAHLQSTAVSSGDTVGSGQYIARSGTSGASTGCHLYMRVMIGANTTDPQVWMRDRGITLGRP